jgi:hypothetical protein
MRFLVTTLQFAESDAYRRLSRELGARGHDVAHVAFSRLAARRLARDGHHATCLPDAMAALGPLDVAAEAARIEARYPITSLRSVWLSDPACRGRPEAWCEERTVRHVLALERVFDRERPDVLVPEVGSETMRTVAHLIAGARGVTTLFMFFTIFPRPLRLYVDTPHAPIVPPEAVQPLDAREREEVEAFVRAHTRRDAPILPYRRAAVTPGKLCDFARHVAVRALVERDNDYLRPGRFVTGTVRQRARAAAAPALYSEVPARPFVYFPLHVTDDFKVKRVIPHCVDQAYLIEQVADALPQGMDVVLKEHPVSVGRNPLGFLRRLVRRENVRLVAPTTSSLDLIGRAQAVVVISSTVGLEALLHARPVLTLGQPFYSGYGVTVDVDSFREIPAALAEVLRFRPDRDRVLDFVGAAMRSTLDGAPASVDASPENLTRLAGSLEAAAERARRREPAPAAA